MFDTQTYFVEYCTYGKLKLHMLINYYVIVPMCELLLLIFFLFCLHTEVVQIFYESATENHVKPAIQSWFKRAPDHVSTNID